MRKTVLLRTAAVGLALVLGGGGAAYAQQAVPAEQPPASYTGDQYVDSQGCVFVRVGYGGSTEWVPRVGRDRRQLCGYRPTGGAGGQTRTASGPATGPGVTVIGAASAPTDAPETPAAQQPRTTTAAAVRTITPPATGTTAVRTITRPTRTAPVATAPAPTAPAAANCPAILQPYMTGSGHRCGPQAVHPGDAARGIQRPGPSLDPASAPGGASGSGTPGYTVMRVPSPPPIPEGYEAVWDDGRLNPYRGLGTYAGAAQMAQVWTNTVPRRLVTPQVPRANAYLVYPAGQVAAAGGHPTDPAALGVTASTRSAATRSAPQAAAETRDGAPVIRVRAGHRHVLAGTFDSREAATSAHARLSRAGLPAILGQIQRNSGTVYAVMAGPYDDPQALGRALHSARNAGFGGATTRR